MVNGVLKTVSKVICNVYSKDFYGHSEKEFKGNVNMMQTKRATFKLCCPLVFHCKWLTPHETNCERTVGRREEVFKNFC